MNTWKRFNEHVPLDEKYYYSELNMEGISNDDIDHVQKMYRCISPE